MQEGAEHTDKDDHRVTKDTELHRGKILLGKGKQNAAMTDVLRLGSRDSAVNDTAGQKKDR
jgi:hypothetical protein